MPGGRPKRSADEKLSEHVHVMVSVADRETLTAKALSAGVSEAEFLRRLIRGAELADASQSPIPVQTDPRLVVELNRIGNNVNQLAKSSHRGSDFVRYWQDVGEELRAVLIKALDRIPE